MLSTAMKIAAAGEMWNFPKMVVILDMNQETLTRLAD